LSLTNQKLFLPANGIIKIPLTVFIFDEDENMIRKLQMKARIKGIVIETC
jgi:hypothetical protein